MLKKAIDTMELVAGTRKRNEKIEILNSNKDNTILQGFYKMAYDWRYRFYISSKNLNIIGDLTADIKDSDWEIFNNLLLIFSRGSVRGNQAKEEITNLFSTLHPSVVKWFMRILDRDLRAGTQWLTINKVWPGMIPWFGVQLGTDVYKVVEDITNLSYPLAVEPKFDGMRIVITPNGCFTRNGAKYDQFDYLVKALLEASPKVVLDAELGNNWNQVAHIAKRDHYSEELLKELKELTFNVFSIIDYEKFKEGEDERTEKERRKALEEWFEEVQPLFNEVAETDQLKIVDRVIVTSSEEAKQLYNKLVDEGYEGIMLKDLNASYKCDRSLNWLKLKPTKELDATIKEVREGSGRHKGRMGTLEIEVDGWQGEQSLFCGGGFTDEDRDWFWKNKDSVVGRRIEFMVDGTSQIGNSSGVASIRFPRFKRLKE